MKVLVLGAGAIGGYYGARLIEGGAEVTFLVRERRRSVLGAQGLVVKSELAPFNEAVRTATAVDGSEQFELVLLACKAYDLASAMESIAPAVERGAKVLPLLNGLAAYDRLDARFGAGAVLGGAAYIATTLQANGDIVHMGLNDKLVVGPRAAGQLPFVARVNDVFAKSSGLRVLSTNIRQELWDKWVFLATGAAMTCLMRAAVGVIVGTADGVALIRQAMVECLAVAKASGQELAEATVAQMEARLLDPSSTWAASMMRDIRQGAAQLEADDIVGDMLKRAVGFGQTPLLLQTAYCHLQAYQSTVKAAEKKTL